MLVVAAALLVAASVLFGAALPLRGAVDRILAVGLLAWAQVVVLCEVLSEAHALNARGFLAGHAILLAAALGVLRWTGRPARLPTSRESAASVRTVVRRHPWLAAFAVAAGLVVLANAGWSFLYEPLDGDANAYHLPRAYYWTTLGTARHFPASDYRLTQMPPDSSFLAAWVLAFSRGFRGLHLFQTAAGLALGVAAAGLARLAGARPAAAFLAGLLVLLFPVVVLQMGTAQNDLLVAAAGVAAVFFGLRALLDSGRESVCAGACFGLAAGLAFGTKLTAAFLVPGLLLTLLALAAAREPPGRLRALIALGTWATGGFLLLGAYNAVLNARELGSPIAGTEGFSHFYGDRPEAGASRLANAARYVRILPNVSPDGGRAAFGPLALVLVGLAPFAAAGSAVDWWRRKRVDGLVRTALVFLAFAYPATFFAARPPFFPEGARYLVPAAVLLGAAVFPLLYADAGARWGVTVAAAVTALGVGVGLTLSGPDGVRKQAYRDARFEDGLNESVMSELARGLPACFPPGSRIGIAAEYNDTVFHLFRALPAYDFVPVSEGDVPRLVREGRIAAAIVGEFRNAAGQGVTKPGFAVPRNVLHVADPVRFFGDHPDGFALSASAAEGRLSFRLKIDRTGTWTGESFLLRVPTGLVRAAGTDAALTLPVGAVAPEGVTVSCAGVSVPARASGRVLEIPIPRRCVNEDRVFTDLTLTRPPGGTDLRLGGEALLGEPR